MPIIKISLSDDEYTQVLKMLGADEMTSKMSIQDFIRYKILGKSNPDIFTPEEAVRRALEKYSSEDEPFTLPDIYGDEWQLLNPRMTGVFGKRFFNYLKADSSSQIEYVGMVDRDRRASYKIKEV